MTHTHRTRMVEREGKLLGRACPCGLLLTPNGRVATPGPTRRWWSLVWAVRLERRRRG